MSLADELLADLEDDTDNMVPEEPMVVEQLIPTSLVNKIEKQG